MTKRTWPMWMGLVTASALGGFLACSETGPDAGPRSNGCISTGCYDTDGGGTSAEGGPSDGGGVTTDGPITYGDPLAGTTKAATLVKGGFQFTEGPVWITNRLLFSDTGTNTIHQLAGGNVTDFRTNANGANGNAVDAQGRLITCEGSRGRVTRTNAALASPTTIANSYAGNAFNAPNDVIARADGNVYFTDPFYGTPPDGGLPQDKQAAYRLAPGAGTGGATRLAFDFTQPNGIALSPDGNTLYIVDNGAGTFLSAALAGDGSLSGTFTKLGDAPGGDGMAVDLAGNLYIAANAGILVFDRAGAALGTITLPAGTPSNCTFGGADRQTLFVTSNNGGGDPATGVYSIHLNVPGLP
jgi:gluconolactonase